jgi:hypothetical protein
MAINKSITKENPSAIPAILSRPMALLENDKFIAGVFYI